MLELRKGAEKQILSDFLLTLKEDLELKLT